MRERPILFSGPMVRAILDGRKTQTRRVVRWPETFSGSFDHLRQDAVEYFNAGLLPLRLRCPHGVPGDLLWVRETFAPFSTGGAVYRADKPRFSPDAHEVVGGSWHPSIYMPRWASRLTLRITDVRVERLQEISAAAALAEGISLDGARPGHDIDIDGAVSDTFAIERFRSLWNSINGSGAWDTNPWVWVVEFERLDCADDCPPGHCACHDGDARTVKREVPPCA